MTPNQAVIPSPSGCSSLSFCYPHSLNKTFSFPTQKRTRSCSRSSLPSGFINWMRWAHDTEMCREGSLIPHGSPTPFCTQERSVKGKHDGQLRTSDGAQLFGQTLVQTLLKGVLYVWLTSIISGHSVKEITFKDADEPLLMRWRPYEQNLRCPGEEGRWKLLSRVQLFVIPWTIYSPWNSPGQNTGVGSLSLLQGIFPTQGSNPDLPHCRQILYQLSHKRSPRILE